VSTTDIPAAIGAWACDQLVKIALQHIMSRRPTRCGICRTRWPCLTYRLATGEPGP
jgi:hypothetical protein